MGDNFPMWEYRRLIASKLKSLKGEMTEREFAKKIGICQSSLNKFINLERSPNVDTLEIICQRLKLDIRDFFPRK